MGDESENAGIPSQGSGHDFRPGSDSEGYATAIKYSMLADLIHHIRDALNPQQIRKTVEVYTKDLQGSFPGTSFQTMSAKILLNMSAPGLSSRGLSDGDFRACSNSICIFAVRIQYIFRQAVKMGSIMSGNSTIFHHVMAG